MLGADHKNNKDWLAPRIANKKYDCNILSVSKKAGRLEQASSRPRDSHCRQVVQRPEDTAELWFNPNRPAWEATNSFLQPYVCGRKGPGSRRWPMISPSCLSPLHFKQLEHLQTTVWLSVGWDEATSQYWGVRSRIAGSSEHTSLGLPVLTRMLTGLVKMKTCSSGRGGSLEKRWWLSSLLARRSAG